MIPQDFIQSLLGRVDIVDVVDRYVKLKKSGANFSACCPFHNEKTPSFTVSPSKQFYHCFGCGAHGNAIGFLMEYSGLTYPDAIRSLAETVGIAVPEVKSRFERPTSAETPGLAARMLEALGYYRGELKKAKAAIDYLKGRGLSGEIAARYGLGYAPDGWQNLESVFPDYAAAAMKDTGLVIDSESRSEDSDGKPSRRYDRFRDRVMFPILDARGNVIGFGGRVIGKGEPKYLNSPETPLFEKGRELYGLYQARRAIRDANQVIVVEGYMDVVALAQHGVENAVATLGTATTPVHVSKLLKLADNVVFCFDGDAAGRKAAWRALEVSLPQLADGKVVSFLFLPPEDDPDTYVRRLGKPAFMKVLKEAKPLSQFLFSELSSHFELGSPEGRAALVAEALPLLKQVVAPTLRILLRDALSKLSGVDRDELADLGPAPTPLPTRQAPPMRKARANAPTPEAQVALALLEFPELAKLVGASVFPASASGAALRELSTFLVGLGERPNVGQVLEHFRDTPSLGLVEAALGSPAFGRNPDLEASRRAVEAYFQRQRVDLTTSTTQELVRVDVSTLSDEQREALLEGLRGKAEFDENLDRENRAKP